MNSVGALRRHHRLALPLLAPSFSRLHIDAEVVICSSSGWAHGAQVTGRKIVYCHAPARWLYQPARYLRTARPAVRAMTACLRPSLELWDRRAAAGASRYLANSTWIAREIKRVYGIAAEVVHGPVGLDASAEQSPVGGIEPGFVLCVSRLLPYKNVDVVVEAFDQLEGQRLVVVGDGPDDERLHVLAGPRVLFLPSVSDAELRWLYASSAGLVTASYEDFGLTPLEAAVFGRPTAALRFGGFLDTVRENETGVYFDEPSPSQIAAALWTLLAEDWDEGELRRQAAAFSQDAFSRRLWEIVEEERLESEPSLAPQLARPRIGAHDVPAVRGAPLVAPSSQSRSGAAGAAGLAQQLVQRLRQQRARV
jgi:glycosyltransferase involved in cell wall biosynthesis